MAEKKPTGKVLVAGAGIAGIRAAIELADTGYQVLLIDSSPQTGGILSKLDYQFPTDHCGMCRMLPMVGRESASEYCIRKGLYHDNIEIMPYTEVQSVKGEPGKFKVDLKKKARYVNNHLCNESGKCIEACPVEVEDEFNHGLTKRKAIFQPVPHNTPTNLLIDMESCTKCGKCVEVCSQNAINLEAEEEIETREIHSIILASGVKLYNTKEYEDAKSYTASPDVLSALAFERLVSGTGAYNGREILRPSDNRPAKKIAWIQCMGSRNKRQGRDYCSSICCMFALKEAVLAKEKGGPDTETTIFYMDMRTFGKGFQEYQEKAVNEHGVKLIRCRVQEVLLVDNGDLQIRFYDPDQDAFFVERYDMVVLSTGQVPFNDHKNWSEKLGAELNPQGLLATETYSRVKLADKPGVFMCGSLMGLTDISEAMSSGIAAAGEATNFLMTLDVDTVQEEEIAEPDADNSKTPSVAVLLPQSQKDDLDIEMLTTGLQQHPGVGLVELFGSIDTEEAEQATLELLQNSNCNRLLIASNQPYMYRSKLTKLAKKAGFNSSLIQVTDLLGSVRRGMQTDDKKVWTARVISEIKADLESLKLKPALQSQSLPITQSAMVVGGGPAGMHASLSLAERGIPVHLIEKSEELGGYAGNNLASTIDGLTPIATTKELKNQIRDHKNIQVHFNTTIEKTVGTLGKFESKLVSTEDEAGEYLHHGAVIISTGGGEGKTDEYCYGDSDKILTQSQCKDALTADELDVENAENIVMIQCVGSREKGKREHCSRVCCMWAISNAIAIKEKNPDVRIFILYRDIMTYGANEKYYTQARELGVIFVPYTLESKPVVEVVDGKPVVTFTESILNSEIKLDTDYLMLSTGVDPEESNKELAKSFQVPLTQDGFFKEADIKWRPIEFHQIGVFMAGLAHSPMPMPDVLMQAEAAAQKAYNYLSKKEVVTAKVVSTVRDSLCVQCQRCVDICPYKARSYDVLDNRIIVDTATCQGCGMCAVTCRNNAAEIPGWSDQQTMAVIDQKLMDDISFSSTD